MSGKSKLTNEERMAVVQEYLDGKGSLVKICGTFSILQMAEKESKRKSEIKRRNCRFD